MKKLFNCDNLGKVMEYIRTKVNVDKDNKTIHLTQPVLIKLLEDEFGRKEDGKVTTLAAPGMVLRKCLPERKISNAQHKMYRKGVGKLVYLPHWT